jgi:hypothetical protein
MTTQETNIRKIINNFINNIDNTKHYTLKQLDKKLETSYTAYVPNTVTDSNKKPPTAYNIYIRERMAELKAQNSALTAKDLMKMAATGWAEYKQTLPPKPTTTIEPAPAPAPSPEPMEEPKKEDDEPTTPNAAVIEIPNAPKKVKKPTSSPEPMEEPKKEDDVPTSPEVVKKVKKPTKTQK